MPETSFNFDKFYQNRATNEIDEMLWCARMRMPIKMIAVYMALGTERIEEALNKAKHDNLLAKNSSLLPYTVEAQQTVYRKLLICDREGVPKAKEIIYIGIRSFIDFPVKLFTAVYEQMRKNPRPGYEHLIFDILGSQFAPDIEQIIKRECLLLIENAKRPLTAEALSAKIQSNIFAQLVNGSWGFILTQEIVTKIGAQLEMLTELQYKILAMRYGLRKNSVYPSDESDVLFIANHFCMSLDEIESCLNYSLAVLRNPEFRYSLRALVHTNILVQWESVETRLNYAVEKIARLEKSIDVTNRSIENIPHVRHLLQPKPISDSDVSEEIDTGEGMTLERFLETKVIQWNIGFRLYNSLARAGFDNAREIVVITEEELLQKRIKGFGPLTLNELKRFLSKNHAYLGMNLNDIKTLS